MLTHKNERPHVCPHCHKDFTRQHDWKRHMELHDPSKKFRCAGTLADGRPWGCNKEFARKDALSRHFKSQQVHLPSSHPLLTPGTSMYRRSIERRTIDWRNLRTTWTVDECTERKFIRGYVWRMIPGPCLADDRRSVFVSFMRGLAISWNFMCDGELWGLAGKYYILWGYARNCRFVEFLFNSNPALVCIVIAIC